MWWDVICCEVTRRNGTGSSQFVMRCGWLRCHVAWFEVAVWCRELEDDLVRTTKKYKYCTVLQSTTPYYTVLQSTTPYFTALQTTTMYYSALHSAQYYNTLQSITYSVLQSMTPYYEILQRYYSIRQSINLFDRRNTWNAQYTARSNRSHLRTSPKFAPATKNDSNDWSSRHIKRHLHCSFTLRGAPRLTLQHHQILCVPRKMTLMIDPAHVWTVNKQCAEHQETPSNITEYCACHEKWLSWLILLTFETSFTMYGARLTLQRDIPKYEENLLNENRWSVIYYGGQCENDPSMIRTWTGHLAPPPFAELTFHALETHFVCAPAIYPNFAKCCTCHENSHSNITKCCACYEKWDSNVAEYSVCHQKRLSWLILLRYETAFTLGEAIASNVTKYCACHANDIPKVQNLWRKPAGNGWSVIYNLQWRTMRDWSEHDPNMNCGHLARTVRRACFSRFGGAVCIEKCDISCSGYLP